MRKSEAPTMKKKIDVTDLINRNIPAQLEALLKNQRDNTTNKEAP
jgi:hypothetical protein